MKIYCKLKLAFFALSIFLSGCIVQSTQLNGLLERVKEQSDVFSENRWLVRYSDYESVVYTLYQRQMAHCSPTI